MVIAAVFFFASLIGIALLFGLKFWELRTLRVVAPEVRTRADIHALKIKKKILEARDLLEQLPPELIRFTRLGIRDSALGVAYLAHAIERQAHRLADLVSHRHSFTKREQKNEFLNKVRDSGHLEDTGEM